MFIIYPKPFLYIVNPLIKRLKKYYKTHRPKINKIILTINKQIKS